jgi:DNA-binding PucR family transcriptional regulator
MNLSSARRAADPDAACLLDQQGSMSRTAEPMNMHRRAVSYRIHQIFDLLDVDPENPDDLLLLQLECRARELA